MYKLSIITCTFNSENFLQKCIDSVLAQNLDWIQFEHIFVDAYSTDATPQIIDTYRETRKDYAVRYIQRSPKGVYNALNEGIKEAKWEYVFFLNSDDFLEPDILPKYLQYVGETGNKDLYYGRLQIVQPDQTISVIPNRYIFLRKLLFRISFNVLVYYPTVLLKRTTLVELGMFDESKKIASDFWLWLHYLTSGKDFVFFPYRVANFVEHPGSLSTNPKNYAIQVSEVSFFRKKYLWWFWSAVDSLLILWWKVKTLFS